MVVDEVAVDRVGEPSFECRVRLARSGSRQLNAAVHRIAITQIRVDGLGQAYYSKKRAEGGGCGLSWKNGAAIPTAGQRTTTRHGVALARRHVTASFLRRRSPLAERPQLNPRCQQRQ